MKKQPKNKASVQEIPVSPTSQQKIEIPTPPSVPSIQIHTEQSNDAKKNMRWYKNQTTSVTGKIEITRYEDGFEFHLVNPMLWNVRLQKLEPLSQDPTKFKSSAATLPAAKNIFWVKWTIYCEKRFGRKIFLEVQEYRQFDSRDNIDRSHERDFTQVREQRITHSSEYENAREIISA